MRPDSSLSYRPDIDGLRAIAVGSVVGFHAFPAWCRSGYIGVDVFFVISGFLITSILTTRQAAGTLSIAQFYASRIKRIFPALCLMLSVVSVLGYAFLLPDQLQELGRQILAGSTFVENFLLWSESGYFDQNAAQKPLLHLWSLAIEEQYYIFFPLLLAFLPRRYLGQTLGVLTLLSLILSIYSAQNDQVTDFFSPLSRFWELFLGALLGLACLRTPDLAGTRLKQGLMLAGFALVIGSAFLLPTGIAFPGAWALAPTLGAVLIIGARGNDALTRLFLANPVVVGLGKISYPLYLWHWPALYFTSALGLDPMARSSRIGAVLVAVLLSVLTYLYVEKPIRFTWNIRAKIPALVLVMAIMASIGGFYELTEGLPQRYPLIVKDILAATQNNHETQSWRKGRCFLILPDQSYADFQSCKSDENALPLPAGAPRILLWGDSHAAHLYGGLQDRFGDRWRILQRTATSCSPFLHDDKNPKHCDSIAQGVRQEVQTTPIQWAILALRWTSHDLQDLPQTVQALKDAGISRITIVGPPPTWRDTLPHQIANLMREKNWDRLDQVPDHLSRGLDPIMETQNVAQDAALSDLSDRLGVHYLSLHHALCNDQGCLTRVGNGIEDLITLDYDHFTEHGSRFVSHLFD